MTTISAREFNQNVSAAMRATDSDVVVITDRGVASHGLLSMAQCERLRGGCTLYDAMAMPAEPGGTDPDDIDFEPGRMRL